jgi:hypothetical protein
MGALTGNTVQSTYLDLVQLGKSGAGLPSHAGKEAALYDGSGAQILGRTAVRSWLDPHPDAAAFAETWEFSTKGTMTQAALEAAGWTFTNCTGSVTGGRLVLTGPTGTAISGAYLTTSLAGDFDICVRPLFSIAYGDTLGTSYGGPSFYVGINGGAAHGLALYFLNGRSRATSLKAGTWANLAGTATNHETYTSGIDFRISRVSGTVLLNATPAEQAGAFLSADTDPTLRGWVGTTQADVGTMDRIGLFLSAGSVSAGSTKTAAFAFIRRFL